MHQASFLSISTLPCIHELLQKCRSVIEKKILSDPSFQVGMVGECRTNNVSVDNVMLLNPETRVAL
jgi:hypothetical protein